MNTTVIEKANIIFDAFRDAYSKALKMRPSFSKALAQIQEHEFFKNFSSSTKINEAIEEKIRKRVKTFFGIYVEQALLQHFGLPEENSLGLQDFSDSYQNRNCELISFSIFFQSISKA